MPVVFANNASSSLASRVEAPDTTLSLAAGTGELFPALDRDAGEQFTCTLVAADGGFEIVRATGRDGDVLTVERGEESTSPRSFAAGEAVELRLTAATMAGLVQAETLQPDTFSELKGVRYVAASAGIADHGDPSRRGSLAWTMAQAGAGTAAVELPGGQVYRIGRSLAVPGNVTLRFQAGAVLDVAGGATLTVDGEIRAGRRQIFAGAGTVAGSLKGQPALPQWFGARGDGATDDTAPLTRAAAFPKVFLPAGTYCLSGPVPLARYGSIEGELPHAGYVDWAADLEKPTPSYAGRAAVLQYRTGLHGPLLTPADDTVLANLVLRSGQARTAADRLLDGVASHMTFTGCRFENLETVVADPTLAESFGGLAVRSCRFISCATLFQGALVDCLVHGNTFTSNTCCFDLTAGSGMNVITANRFEWNTIPIQSYQGRANVISGNLFDASLNAAVKLRRATDNSVVANVFWRNGRSNAEAGTRSHIHILESSSGNLIEGNTFLKGSPDNDPTQVWPRHVVELESVTGTNIFRSNATVAGCTESPFQDPWWSSPDSLLADDVHVKSIGNPDASNDTLVEIVKRIAFVAAGPVNVHLYENRKFTAFTDVSPGKITLVGHGAVTLTDTSGQANSLRGLVGIAYGQAYTQPPAQLAAIAPPAAGSWTRGSLVWNTAPAPSGPVGWVCTAAGGPGTWKPFGTIGA